VENEVDNVGQEICDKAACTNVSGTLSTLASEKRYFVGVETDRRNGDVSAFSEQRGVWRGGKQDIGKESGK
jgi:hypothetical protein